MCHRGWHRIQPSVPPSSSPDLEEDPRTALHSASKGSVFCGVASRRSSVAYSPLFVALGGLHYPLLESLLARSLEVVYPFPRDFRGGFQEHVSAEGGNLESVGGGLLRAGAELTAASVGGRILYELANFRPLHLRIPLYSTNISPS